MGQKFNYIIFHRGCLDGFSGYFVAKMSGRLENNVTEYPDVPSTNYVPPEIKDKDIIIIDVAYKKSVLEEIFSQAKSVVFIDHHVSIKNDVEELYNKYNHKNNITIIYDEKRSGATLSWKYFFGRQSAPLFLKYVEDQDTGKWELEDTKPFIYALKSYYHLSTENKSFNKWFRLLKKETVHEMIEDGKKIELYNKHLVGVNFPRYSLERFPSQKVFEKYPDIFEKPAQYKVAVYNGLHCPSVTDLAREALARIDGCDFCIMWMYNLSRKQYVMSLRSNDTDVGRICKAFGGGGHKLAGACSFSRSVFSIDDIFEGKSLPRSHHD